MTLTVRLILIVALVFSIIIPFGYYLIGEKEDAINVLSRQMYFSFLGPALWRQL